MSINLNWNWFNFFNFFNASLTEDKRYTVNDMVCL